MDRWLAENPAGRGAGAAAVVAVIGLVLAMMVLRDGWTLLDAEPLTVAILFVPFSYTFVHRYARRIAALIRRWEVEH